MGGICIMYEYNFQFYFGEIGGSMFLHTLETFHCYMALQLERNNFENCALWSLQTFLFHSSCHLLHYLDVISLNVYKNISLPCAIITLFTFTHIFGHIHL